MDPEDNLEEFPKDNSPENTPEDSPDQQSRNSGRNSDGRFAPGNPGKPRGSRHRATRAVMDLLGGSAHKLTTKALEMALTGDTTALRLCIERIAPPMRDAPVTFTLPSMTTAADAARAAAAVLASVSEGELTPTEGAHVMALIETYRRTLETTELELRVLALEGGR